MPIYEFECECGAEKEIMLPFSEAGREQGCSCGQVMRRRFSLASFTISETGRDKVLQTLNKEKGGYTFPGGDTHRPRYGQAMAKSLDQTRPVIGRGFNN